MPDRPRESVQGLQRGFAVIKAFTAEAPAPTIAALSQRTGLTRAVTSRRSSSSSAAVRRIATASTSGTSSVGPCRAISAATSRSASPACRRFTPARCTTRAAIRSTPSRFRASIGGAFLRVLRERSRESAEIGDQPVAQECRAGLWRRNVAQKTRAETSRTGAAQDFSPACACCNACRRQNGLFSGWSVTARQAR